MLAIAIDLGGSHLSCAILCNGDLISHREIHVDPSSFCQLLPSIEQLIWTMKNDAGLDMRKCAGIVFGFPGLVDPGSGRVISANAKFSDAEKVDLPRWSASVFGVPLYLENDARLALLGEQCCGAAQGAEDVVLVTLGTGIGAVAMLCGKLLRGKYDQAGCLGGHLPVVLDGRQCTCGNIGCAEAEASTWALPSICRSWPGFQESELALVQDVDFRRLFKAVDKGDQVATEVLAHCCRVWSSLAVALVHAYAPQVLLFGGGVMARANDVLPVICAHVQRHAWSPRGSVQMKTAALGSAAPLYGAAQLLREILT
jgi:glucokinase